METWACVSAMSTSSYARITSNIDRKARLSNAELGMSGSTQWNNAARSRLYFTASKMHDDTQSDVRELRVMKSNYGPPGEIVRLRWQNGVFVPLTSPSVIERAAAEEAADAVFLGKAPCKRSRLTSMPWHEPCP